jgi:hypothetical protein
MVTVNIKVLVCCSDKNLHCEQNSISLVRAAVVASRFLLRSFAALSRKLEPPTWIHLCMFFVFSTLMTHTEPAPRPPARYDTCGMPASAGRFGVNNTIPSPFHTELSLIESVCCDQRNVAYAEPQFLFRDLGLFSKLNTSGVTTFYDSASGLPLFRAPVNRNFSDFETDTNEHGWPSFRAAEVITSNVVTDTLSGLVHSKSGTHLGSYLPDQRGARWCIDLCCIAGLGASRPIHVYGS